MPSAIRVLFLSLGLYIVSLLVVVVFRFVLKKWREKWFATSYDRLPIAIALVLLAAAVGMFASGAEATADEIAIMAYYMLVLGVILQVIAHIREQRATRRIEGSGCRHSGSRGEDEDHPLEDK